MYLTAIETFFATAYREWYDFNIPKMKQAKDDAAQPVNYRNKVKKLLTMMTSSKAKQDLATYGEAKRNFFSQLMDKVRQVCIISKFHEFSEFKIRLFCRYHLMFSIVTKM